MPSEAGRVRFSVVIPNWNGKNHLPECLDSLRRQTFPDFEVLLVDNGSHDGSVEFVRAHYPEVALLTLPENRGFAGGVNAGIRAAKGQFVVLLNNDTEVEPRWLQALDSAIHDHPDVWFFASKLVNYFDRRVVDSAGDTMDLDLGPYKIGEREPIADYQASRFVFGACGGGGCYRRELFDKVGLFDEDFFAYFEDIDFSFRANWAGFRCLFVPDAVIYHKVGGTATTSAKTKTRFTIMTKRNHLMLIAKNYSPGLLLRHGHAILTVLVLKKLASLFKIRSTLARRLGEVFCPEFQFLKLWPRVREKRKALMAARAISDQDMERICARPPHESRFFLVYWLKKQVHAFRRSWSKR